MARKSIFTKITDILLDKDDNEETAEDIDRRLEAEIAAIQAEKVATLEGTKVLKDDWQNKGSAVFLLDLGPLYAMIGGRNSAMGTRLPDSCEHFFSRLVPWNEGRARMKGDFFVMTFTDPSREKGFARAAQVVNGIGLQTIGERFKTLEIPDLFVAADAADVTGEDGDFDPTKAKGQMQSGGIGARLGDPGENAPAWLKFSVKKAKQAYDLVKITMQAKRGEGDDALRPRRRGDPDWVEPRTNRRKRISSDPSLMERRRGRDRRVNK